MSDYGDDAYQPTDQDRELFGQITRLIHERPDLFAEAGKALDEQYSHKGLIRHRAKEKRRKHLRSKGVPNAMPLTRAGCRRHGLPIEPEPLQRDDGGLKHPPKERQRRHAAPRRFSNGKRKPISTYERFLAAIDDLMSGDHLDVMVQRVRHSTAQRILLLTWLIIDPDADQFTPVLTHEFQGAGWQTTDPDGDPKTSEFALSRPDEWGDDEAGFTEYFFDRYWWRMTVFEFNPGWFDWVRQAWGVIQGEREMSVGSSPLPTVATNRQAKNVGRPTLSVTEQKNRQKVVADWKRAKAAGVMMKDFCRDQNLTLKRVQLCLNWDSQRRRRGSPAS